MSKFPKELFDFEARPLSYSRMKHILKSPSHFAQEWTKPSKPPSDAMKLGSLVDLYLFEVEKFEDKYVLMPEINKRTNAGKAEYELFVEQNKGKTFVDQDQIDKAKLLAQSLKDHPVANEFVMNCQSAQHELRWTDKSTGIKLRGFRDGLSEFNGNRVQWDLKTAADASTDKFQRVAIDLCYDIQAASYFYGHALNSGEFLDWYNVVIETEEPFAINILKADNNFMQFGKQRYRRCLDMIKYCLDNDCFDSGYLMHQSQYNILSVPSWKLKELEE